MNSKWVLKGIRSSIGCLYGFFFVYYWLCWLYNTRKLNDHSTILLQYSVTCCSFRITCILFFCYHSNVWHIDGWLNRSMISWIMKRHPPPKIMLTVSPLIEYLTRPTHVLSDCFSLEYLLDICCNENVKHNALCIPSVLKQAIDVPIYTYT